MVPSSISPSAASGCVRIHLRSRTRSVSALETAISCEISSTFLKIDMNKNQLREETSWRQLAQGNQLKTTELLAQSCTGNSRIFPLEPNWRRWFCSTSTVTVRESVLGRSPRISRHLLVRQIAFFKVSRRNSCWYVKNQVIKKYTKLHVITT